jgi:heptosyltransferase-2
MRKRSVAEINQLTAGPASHPASSIQYPASAHHLHQYLHLVAALGANPAPLAPRLVVADEELIAVAKRFGLENLAASGRPLLALNPGAEYGPAKRWPIERFIAAAREIQQRTNCTWLILGGQADVALAEQIASAIRSPQSAIRNLSGQTSLCELMALLKSCRVLLSNDTGPMHVAAALGTPVVVPFGSTSPEITGPGLPGDTRHQLLRSDVPCAPCFLRECPIDFRCMNGISVERVVEAVLQATKTSNLER